MTAIIDLETHLRVNKSPRPRSLIGSGVTGSEAVQPVVTPIEVAAAGDKSVARIVQAFHLLPGEGLKRDFPTGGTIQLGPQRKWIWIEGPDKLVEDGVGETIRHSIAKLTFIGSGEAVVEGVDLDKSIDALPIDDAKTLGFFNKMLNDTLEHAKTLSGYLSSAPTYVDGNKKDIYTVTRRSKEFNGFADARAVRTRRGFRKGPRDPRSKY